MEEDAGWIYLFARAHGATSRPKRRSRSRSFRFSRRSDIRLSPHAVRAVAIRVATSQPEHSVLPGLIQHSTTRARQEAFRRERFCSRYCHACEHSRVAAPAVWTISIAHSTSQQSDQWTSHGRANAQ
jgi:hypothetical protein